MARNKKISFAGPWMTEKDIDYVVDAVKRGWYETYDAHVKKLEAAVCRYLDVDYALATHCCTLALHLACQALEIGPGDEVICTDFSSIATGHSIAYTGATPVFVDIEPDTWCICPKAIRKAITARTKAIMLVHCFGQPAMMDEIMSIAQQHSLRVIEDAAPALGAEYKMQKVGTFGDIGCFSFHGAKIAASGEGGILVTNDADLFAKASFLASMGRTEKHFGFWSEALGFQYTMGNVTAALALAQVERIDELVAMKRRIFGWYSKRISGTKGVKLITESEDCKGNYCYPSILIEPPVTRPRDEILNELFKLNIHCRPGFPRMSQFPMYESRFANPSAKRVEEYGISLPAAANLKEEDVEFVCQSLIELIN